MKEDVLMQPGPVDHAEVRPDTSSTRLSRPWRMAWLVLFGLLATAAHLWADESLYKFGSFPKGLSTYAGEIDDLHDKIFVITGLVFLITEGLLLLFIFMFPMTSQDWSPCVTP